MTSADHTAFLDFVRDPSPSRLATLLTALQDRIYTICLQILRRPPDAEDACQEVLVEIARGARAIGDARAFKVWLYRVAVHTALDRKEAIARQARLARAAPPPEDPPMNDAERSELMRAIGRLDDRARCMVLEHYFEKSTLEEIAAREGVSAVAVWKRLERARETLRQALLGAGYAVAAGGVAQSLESVAPAVAPSGLVAKAVIAGGVVMGTKSIVTGGTIVAALLLAGAASTGGYFVGAARGESRVRELQSELARADRDKPAPSPVVVETPEAPVPSPAPVPEADPPSPSPPAKEARPVRVEDPDRVFYGRPRKPDIDEAVKADSWDEFYKRAKELKLRGPTLEEAIFKRLGKELGIEPKSLDTLKALFEREREEATRAIVDNFGGAATFRQKMDDSNYNWNAIQPEWLRVREIVRRTFTDEYLGHLTPGQFSLFSEHLRNGEIGLESSYSNDGTYYLVGGVGKLPK